MKTRTASQSGAILCPDPEILLLAGPGSGKTTTTVARINRIIDDGTDPQGIVALTFTNAAARELEDRIEKATPQSAILTRKRLGYVGTLHGFALRMLKEHGGEFGYGDRLSIISPESAADLLESKAKALGCKMPIDKLLERKGQTKRPEKATELPDVVIASFYADLREAGIVDFDVLLSEFDRFVQSGGFVKLAAKHPYPRFTHLFVDEVQDSSPIDWAIYRGMAIANKFYVGDPDQAIYGFRGGDVGEMMIEASFTKNPPRNGPTVTVLKLEENFRSHTEICEAANRLIAHNVQRLPKETISALGKGGTVHAPAEFLNEGEEIGQVTRWIQQMLNGSEHSEPMLPRPSIAILCRNNALVAQFQRTLVAVGLPVIARDRSNLPRDWGFARALVEFLVHPENDTLAFFYLVAKWMREGRTQLTARANAHEIKRSAAAAGKTINDFVPYLQFPANAKATDAGAILRQEGASLEATMIIVEKLKELPDDADMLTLALSLGAVHDKEEKPLVDEGVTITTIHGAKGREFDVVFVTGCEDEFMPGQRKDADIEEERRLMFVAITRARKYLYITSAAQRVTAWKAIANHTPSRFIKELMT